MASVSRRFFLGGAMALPFVARAGGAAFSLRNARILLGDGTEVTGGIRVEGGIITDVGAGITDGEDQGGKVIFPGFWDGGSRLGLWEIDQEGETHDDLERSDAVMPQARVVDAYNPLSEVIPVARRAGVLGTLVTPSGGTLIPGQAAWMRTDGLTVADATILSSAGICVNFGHSGTGATGGPTSRMGVAARLRDLLDANKPTPAPAKKKKDEKSPDPPTRQKVAFQALHTRTTRALFYADRADDLLTAVDLAKEYQLDVVLMGCAEGHLVARQLADAGFPCIVGPVSVQPDGWEHPHAVYENPAILHKAGVKIGLRQGGGPHWLREISTELCLAVANGLPWEAAIAAGCANNPAIWGLKVGRIAVGYEASFVRCDGDPIQPRTRMEAAWMKGAPVSMRSRQSDLYDRYKTLK